MSGDTVPIIHTVGSVDRHDQAELSEKITPSVDKVPLAVLDDKLDNIKSKREQTCGDTVTAPVTHHKAAGPSPSSEPGVVGEVPRDGSADPSDGDAAASRGVETKSSE
jgi:hypothetical protein